MLNREKHGWRTRLLESTRGQILQLLRVKDRTVNELAGALRLTDNAVRAHLTSLERDGLLRQSGIQHGFRKPHATYALTAEAEQIFPKAYGTLLDILLTVFSKKLSDRELRAGMREAGRKIAAAPRAGVEVKNRKQRIETDLGVLKEMGGADTVHENGG